MFFDSLKCIFFWKLIKCFLSSKYPSQWRFFLEKDWSNGFLGHFSKTSKWIWFFENWSNVFEVLTSTLSAETPVILALIVKDRIEKNIFQKCSIKSIRLDLLISKISRHWHFQNLSGFPSPSWPWDSFFWSKSNLGWGYSCCCCCWWSPKYLHWLPWFRRCWNLGMWSLQMLWSNHHNTGQESKTGRSHDDYRMDRMRLQPMVPQVLHKAQENRLWQLFVCTTWDRMSTSVLKLLHLLVDSHIPTYILV